MVGSDIADRFVTLAPDDLVVPADAYRLWLSLRLRDFTLRQDGRTLIVAPAERLTPEDCTGLRRWKWHVMMLEAFGRRTDVPAPRAASVARTCRRRTAA